MIWRDASDLLFARDERGQASLLLLAVVGVVLAGAVVLFAFGNALGAKGRHQRAADLAAISAAQEMRDLYPRLFEPPVVEPGVPNPRRLRRPCTASSRSSPPCAGRSGTACASARAT